MEPGLALNDESLNKSMYFVHQFSNMCSWYNLDLHEFILSLKIGVNDHVIEVQTANEVLGPLCFAFILYSDPIF